MPEHTPDLMPCRAAIVERAMRARDNAVIFRPRRYAHRHQMSQAFRFMESYKRLRHIVDALFFFFFFFFFRAVR